MFDQETYRRVIQEAMYRFAVDGWDALDQNPYHDKHRGSAWMHGLDMANERKEYDTALKLWREKQFTKRQGSASKHGLEL